MDHKALNSGRPQCTQPSNPLLTSCSVVLYTAVHPVESVHSVFNLPSALPCVGFKMGLGPGSFGFVSKAAMC